MNVSKIDCKRNDSNIVFGLLVCVEHSILSYVVWLTILPDWQRCACSIGRNFCWRSSS